MGRVSGADPPGRAALRVEGVVVEEEVGCRCAVSWQLNCGRAHTRDDGSRSGCCSDLGVEVWSGMGAAAAAASAFAPRLFLLEF
jgi:hypothetical protein